MLPGRLTEAHIVAAEKRGDGYIYYKHRAWSLEELWELAGRNQRVERVAEKPIKATRPESARSKDRDGTVAEHGSDAREAAPYQGEEPDTSSEESTQ